PCNSPGDWAGENRLTGATLATTVHSHADQYQLSDGSAANRRPGGYSDRVTVPIHWRSGTRRYMLPSTAKKAGRNDCGVESTPVPARRRRRGGQPIAELRAGGAAAGAALDGRTDQAVRPGGAGRARGHGADARIVLVPCRGRRCRVDPAREPQ